MVGDEDGGRRRRIRREPPSRLTRSSRAPRSRPAVGSSSSTSPGSPRATGPGGPAGVRPTTARRTAGRPAAPAPHAVEQLDGAAPVGVAVGRHHVSRRRARRSRDHVGRRHPVAQHGRERRAHEPDARAQAADVDPPQALTEDLDRPPAGVGGRAPATRISVVFPEPLGPSTIQRSCGATSQSTPSRMVTSSRTSPTPDKRSANDMGLDPKRQRPSPATRLSVIESQYL